MAVIYQLPILELALVDYRSASTICIRDLSTYLTVPVAADVALQITPPGYPTVNVTFTPGADNVYKCVDLGIADSDVDCCPLPDGIYSVLYTTPGAAPSDPLVTLDQKFIKIDNIKCCYQKAFLKVDLDCGCQTYEQKDYLQQLQRVKLYLDGSVAECNNGNYRAAYEYYKRADTMLDKIKCRFPTIAWKPCGC